MLGRYNEGNLIIFENNSTIRHLFDDQTMRWCSTHWDGILNIEILNFFFRQSFEHNEGIFLEPKNPKNHDPQGVLHPKSRLKSQQFLVISLIYTPCGQWTDHEVSSMWLITKNLWILKKMFWSKTIFGFRFFQFFTSISLSPPWWVDGWKNFPAQDCLG